VPNALPSEGQSAESALKIGLKRVRLCSTRVFDSSRGRRQCCRMSAEVVRTSGFKFEVSKRQSATAGAQQSPSRSASLSPLTSANGQEQP
jgi:hypothetical protein